MGAAGRWLVATVLGYGQLLAQQDGNAAFCKGGFLTAAERRSGTGLVAKGVKGARTENSGKNQRPFAGLMIISVNVSRVREYFENPSACHKIKSAFMMCCACSSVLVSRKDVYVGF